MLSAIYADHTIIGSICMRPGYQKLLEDAREGQFQLVIAEALDRMSRDQGDVAALYKHLRFASAKLVMLAQSEVSELHVGLKSTMNARFSLRTLPRRCAGPGRSRAAGTIGRRPSATATMSCEQDARGEPCHGRRRINEAEAAVIRQIFRDFSAGQSPRAIAHALNAEGMCGPHGNFWGPSTIYGNWRRGTGILNNELYLGRIVWNRQRYVNDPVTHKRVAPLNLMTELVIQEVPELRIVDDGLWRDVK